MPHQLGWSLLGAVPKCECVAVLMGARKAVLMCSEESDTMPSLPPPAGSIIDITEGSLDTYIQERLNSTFVEAKKRGKTPVLPDELLYDGPGLHYWSQIIYRPAYYQVHDETRIFIKYGQDIVSYIQPSATLIDIGSG
jgi:hypothetical protein